MAVFRRGSRWGARIYDPRTGGQRWLGTFGTKREAQEAVRAAEVEKARPDSRDETCDEFAERWMRDYAHGRDPSTVRHYEQMLPAFARDFAGRRLRDVSRVEARAWAVGGPVPKSIEKVARGWKDAVWEKRPEGRRLVVPAHQGQAKVVRTMFSDARRDGLAEENPFAGMRLDGSRGRKDITPLSEAELGRLVGLAGECWPDDEWGETTYAAMILTAAYTGIRPGELHAIRWEDVDFKRNLLHVEQQFSSRIGTYKKPKSHKARTVVLPDQALEAIRRVPRVVPREGEPDVVFRTQRGSPFNQRSHHYYWDSVRKAFRRPGMDFYELRHFCGSFLADRGASPMDIAQQLGHQDGGRLAMELYIHSYEDRARERLLGTFRGEDDVEDRRAAG